MAKGRILLLSAYDAQSHRDWRRGLVEHLDAYDWVVKTQPPRNFSWRSRGNSLYWAYAEADLLSTPFDAIIATSMVDLSTLRGLIPSLGQVPTAVYFHENQFVYPERAGKRPDVNFGLTNLYTALCADRIIFNSAYNQDTFTCGARDLLARMPDQVPPGVIETLESRKGVIPVPLSSESFITRTTSLTGPLHILWNHRWEYDKAPERFFEALMELAARGRSFRLHVLGQSFRQKPPIFEAAREHLASHIETWGYVPDRKAYEAILSRCDLVVSTALHEFQGLAMLEAVAAGCHPIAPRRLAYREFFEDGCLYASHLDDARAEKEALVAALQVAIDNVETLRSRPPPDLRALSWLEIGPRYEQLLEELTRPKGS